MHEVNLVLNTSRLRAMSNTPKSLLGEGKRWAQDDFGALLGERFRAPWYLGFVANIEPDLGKGQFDRFDRIAF